MESFKLYNVKAFDETIDINLKRINIFVGKNSSGKSSLLRFPVVLSQTFLEDVYTPLLFFGNLIDYGNYDDVIHNRNKEDMKLVFRFGNRELAKYLRSYTRLSRKYNEGYNVYDFFMEKVNTVSVEVVITKMERKITVKEFRLLINDEPFANIYRKEKGQYYLGLYSSFVEDGRELKLLNNSININIDVSFNRFIPQISYNEKVAESILREISHNTKIDNSLLDRAMLLIKRESFLYLGEKDGYDLIESNSNILRQFLEIFKTLELVENLNKAIYSDILDFSNQITYIGPFRKNPERIYRDSENSFKDVGKNGENASMLLRQAQQSKSDLLDKVSSWFIKSMGYGINIEEIENSNLFKLMIYNENKARGSNIIDVGYGIAQVLPIVTQIYLRNRQTEEFRHSLYRLTNKKIFVMEQPELHLHPAAQANLADLFVEKVVSDSNSKFLIETHSEHLIRRLQVLIADKDIPLNSEDIAIYYVDKQDNDSSTIRKMNMNLNGQFIDKWPSGFFDKGYELSRQLLWFSRKSDEHEN